MQVLDKAGLEYYNSLIENKYLQKTGGTVTGNIYGVTASPNDNSTKLATTAYVQAELQDYATLNDIGNIDLSGFLPLSGGTMTGTISSSDYNMLVGTADDGFYRIVGATSPSNGAHLVLTGNNFTENPGSFTLRVNNATTDIRLVGKPDGTLTWNDNNIATTNNTVNLTGNQTVAGTKTFSSSPIAPTPAQTDDSTKIATTAYVKDCVPKSIGSATQPVYTNANGVVTKCTYTLGKSVPSNAEFTDTTYDKGNVVLIKAGTDTAGRVWAASTLAAAFGGAVSAANTGSVNLPGGIILKWGRATETNSNNPSTTITFAEAFPNHAFVAVACNDNAVSPDYVGMAVTGLSTTTLKLYSGSNGGKAIKWIAIGN